MELFLCNFSSFLILELMQLLPLSFISLKGTAWCKHIVGTLERRKVQGSCHVLHWMPRPSLAIYLGK